MSFFFSLLMLSFLSIVSVNAHSLPEEDMYHITQARQFVPHDLLRPVMGNIENHPQEEKTILKNIFNHHATANPFSEYSPFYQFKKKKALIGEMYKLTSLIASDLGRYSSLLFDYLYIIATFGGQSILKDETHEFYQDYRYFLNEIATYEKKNPLDFLALCLKMGILLAPKNMEIGGFSPPFDKPLKTIKREFWKTHTDAHDLTKFLIQKTATEGPLYHRIFSSIHGIAKYFQDAIPLPFMGDLDAGDIVRATPNGVNKLWLSGLPVTPIFREFHFKNIKIGSILFEKALLSKRINSCSADGGTSTADMFLIHDWFHLSTFASSLYATDNTFYNVPREINAFSPSLNIFFDSKESSFIGNLFEGGEPVPQMVITNRSQDKDKNLRMISKIQEWINIENPKIDRKLKEFIAFYLTHEEGICDPFHHTFQNNFRYFHFKERYDNLINPLYYATLLPPQLLADLKKDGKVSDEVGKIFDDAYMDLREFVSPEFPLKESYISPFMRTISDAYNDGSSFPTFTLINPYQEKFFILDDKIFEIPLSDSEISVNDIDIHGSEKFTIILRLKIDENKNGDKTLDFTLIGMLQSLGASLNDPNLVKRALEHRNYNVAKELILRGAPYTPQQFKSAFGNSPLL